MTATSFLMMRVSCKSHNDHFILSAAAMQLRALRSGWIVSESTDNDNGRTASFVSSVSATPGRENAEDVPCGDSNGCLPA